MDKDKLQQLIEQLRNGSDRQRRAASYKLGKSNDPDAVPALINSYNDIDSSVRQNVIVGVKSIRSKEAVEFLISHGIEIIVPITEHPIKVHDFINGFIGWAIASNMLAFPIGVIVDSILKTRDYEAVINLTAAIILALELVVIATAFIRRKTWIGFGILSSIVATAVVWLVIFILPSYADGKSLSTAMADAPMSLLFLVLPFPISVMFFM